MRFPDLSGGSDYLFVSSLSKTILIWIMIYCHWPKLASRYVQYWQGRANNHGSGDNIGIEQTSGHRAAPPDHPPQLSPSGVTLSRILRRNNCTYSVVNQRKWWGWLERRDDGKSCVIPGFILAMARWMRPLDETIPPRLLLRKMILKAAVLMVF